RVAGRWARRPRPLYRFPGDRLSSHAGYHSEHRRWRVSFARGGTIALLQIDAVAHLAEARIGLDPSARARDPDHVQIGAASEAQPLHPSDVVAGAQGFADGHHLMAWMAADPERLR